MSFRAFEIPENDNYNGICDTDRENRFNVPEHTKTLQALFIVTVVTPMRQIS